MKETVNWDSNPIAGADSRKMVVVDSLAGSHYLTDRKRELKGTRVQGLFGPQNFPNSNHNIPDINSEQDSSC